MTEELKGEIQYLPLSEISYADKNPKDHDIGAIYESIKRHGFVNYPLMNKATMKLLAGHGRCDTLKVIKRDGEFVPKGIQVRDDGEWLIPVLVSADIENEGEALAYLLGDNRLTEIGGYHTMDLIDTLQDVLKETGDLDGTGYELEDIEDILADISRDSFEVKDYGEGSAGDESTVKVEIGRYKFKIPVEDFYDWEQSVKGQINTSEVNEFNEWIKQQLGF